LAADTVIEVLAMVIKVKSASVTPHTMIAFQENTTVTNHAFLDVFRGLLINFSRFINQGVDRVHESEVNVIVAEQQDKCIVN
jgi:hypothetical protein